MNRRLRGAALVAAVAGLAALAACSGKNKVDSDLGVSGAPDWVNEGTQVLNDKGGRLFHGVGQAPAMGDESLQISTADTRARAELARVLTSYLDVVSTDYASSAASGGNRVGEESVTRQIRNLTRVNLSGARILGHWKDPKTGTIYAIAELDLEQVQRTAEAVGDMNADLRRYLEDNGGNIFDRMAKKEGAR